MHNAMPSPFATYTITKWYLHIKKMIRYDQRHVARASHKLYTINEAYTYNVRARKCQKPHHKSIDIEIFRAKHSENNYDNEFVYRWILSTLLIDCFMCYKSNPCQIFFIHSKAINRICTALFR